MGKSSPGKLENQHLLSYELAKHILRATNRLGTQIIRQLERSVLMKYFYTFFTLLFPQLWAQASLDSLVNNGYPFAQIIKGSTQKPLYPVPFICLEDLKP